MNETCLSMMRWCAIGALLQCCAFGAYADEPPTPPKPDGMPADCGQPVIKEGDTAAVESICVPFTLPPTTPLPDYYYDGVFYYYYTACCDPPDNLEQQHYGILTSDVQIQTTGCPTYHGDSKEWIERIMERNPKADYYFANEPDHAGAAAAGDDNFHLLSFRGVKDAKPADVQAMNVPEAPRIEVNDKAVRVTFVSGNPHANFDPLRNKEFILLTLPAHQHMRNDQNMHEGEIYIAVEAGDDEEGDPFRPYSEGVPSEIPIYDDARNHRSVSNAPTGEPGALFTARMKVRPRMFPDGSGLEDARFDVNIFIVTRTSGFGRP